MREKIFPVWWIARREVKDYLRDWRSLVPLLTLTIIFPLLMGNVGEVVVHFVNKYGAHIIADHLVPFFILIIGFLVVCIT